MRIVLPREEFLEAVGWTARILPAKPYIPVYGGVYIIADGDETHFCAYDTEVSAEMQVKGKIMQEGEALLSGRLLAAISRVLPKQPEVALFDQGGTQVYLRCGKAEFTLPGMDFKQYPKLPELPKDRGAVDGAELAEALSQVLPATSNDQALPHLCAVYMVVDSTGITLWGTDKHRVATRRISWEPETGSLPAQMRLLVPARAVAELSQLADKTKVFLGFDSEATSILGFSADARMTTTRLIDSPFPNCASIMPKTHAGLAVVNASEMVGAMSRAMLLDTSEFPRVHLDFAEADIKFNASGEGTGGINDSIDAEYRGLPMQLFCNPKYLSEAVTHCRSDKVIIGLQDHLTPILVAPFTDWPPPIEHPNDTYGWQPIAGDYRHVVMPTIGAKS